jgi:hypothetical protein
MFGLGYIFAYQIQMGIREVQHWITVIAALAIAAWSLYRYYQASRRAGLPVGPPVLYSDDVPLPPDELGSSGKTAAASASDTGAVSAPAGAAVPAGVAPAAPPEKEPEGRKHASGQGSGPQPSARARPMDEPAAWPGHGHFPLNPDPSPHDSSRHAPRDG